MRVPAHLRWLLCRGRHVPAFRRVLAFEVAVIFIGFYLPGLRFRSHKLIRPLLSVLFRRADVFSSGSPQYVLSWWNISLRWSLKVKRYWYFRWRFLSVVRTVCSVPSAAIFGCSLKMRSDDFFRFLSKNAYGWWKFPLTCFIGFLVICGMHSEEFFL